MVIHSDVRHGRVGRQSWQAPKHRHLPVGTFWRLGNICNKCLDKTLGCRRHTWSIAAVCITLGGGTVNSMRWSQILVENRDFSYPTCIRSLTLGGSCLNIVIKFCIRKIYRMAWLAWLPDGEKFENMFTRFDRIHERDRQTDKWTTHDGIGRAYA